MDAFKKYFCTYIGYNYSTSMLVLSFISNENYLENEIFHFYYFLCSLADMYRFMIVALVFSLEALCSAIYIIFSYG